MYDPNLILPDLLKKNPNGELLVELQKILKIKNQHLRNKTFCKFYVKWKDLGKRS